MGRDIPPALARPTSLVFVAAGAEVDDLDGALALLAQQDVLLQHGTTRSLLVLNDTILETNRKQR